VRYEAEVREGVRRSLHRDQKEKRASNSIRLFAVDDAWKPPARAFDCPNSIELRLPIGGARFTLLRTL